MAPRGAQLWARGAVTIALGAAYTLLACVPIPGVDPAAMAELGARVGIFALGIQPALTGYILVELACAANPPWMALRRGGPRAQQKLHRAAIITSVVLAAFQSFGVALYLESMGAVPGHPSVLTEDASRLLTWATLTGGACATILVARWISRAGLVNGFVLLALVVPALSAPASASGVTSTTAILGVGASVMVVGATLVALGGYGPGKAASTWVPVPASSIAPATIAASVVAMAASLAPFSDLAAGTARWLAPPPTRLLVTGVVAAIAVVGFSAGFHRPHEMSDALSRVSGTAVGARAIDARVRTAIAPTLGVVACLVLCEAVLAATPWAFVQASLLALGTAAVVDLVASVRAHGTRGDWVAIREERRPWLVPAMVEALGREGVECFPRNLAQQTLLRFFGPFVLAEVMVPARSAKRARKLLAGMLASTVDPPVDASPEAPAPKRAPARAAMLSMLVAASAVLVLLDRPAPERPTTLHAAASLQIVRVDDGTSIFEHLDETALPRGMSLRTEAVPLGPEHQVTGHFVRMVYAPGESHAATLARARAWAKTVSAPEGRRIAFGEFTQPDEAGRAVPQGVRSYVLAGAPIVSAADVVHAHAVVDDEAPYVAITLTDAAAGRFEQATREGVKRRIAIVVDDRVESAPVVQAPISGGSVRITMGAGDPAETASEARNLAAALGGS